MVMQGAYGKMPSLGDFFRIGLPRSFCEPWDAWLQSVLLDSRAVLGACWEERYNAAPIWRFSLAAGIAGPDAVRGVLMPSVDRVGRAFPLTLVSGQADFIALEDVALAALDDDMTKERLEQALEGLEHCVDAKPNVRGATWCAVFAERSLSFRTPQLPLGAEAHRLFDPILDEVRE